VDRERCVLLYTFFRQVTWSNLWESEDIEIDDVARTAILMSWGIGLLRSLARGDEWEVLVCPCAWGTRHEVCGIPRG
jgi:hypothetical protein